MALFPEGSAYGSPAPVPRSAAGRRAPWWRRVFLVATLVTVAVIVLGAATYWALEAWEAPRVRAMTPERGRTGRTVVLEGSRFARTPEGNLVTFGKGGRAKVLEATTTKLTVEVPDLGKGPGSDVEVKLVVRAGERSSWSRRVHVYSPPSVSTVVPDLAQPGELVTVTGAGFGSSPKVQIGSRTAEVVEATGDRLSVRVPGDSPDEETQLIVMGEFDPADPSPFFVSHGPVLIRVDPATATLGDVLKLTGGGFSIHAAANRVLIGGTTALVVSAASKTLEVVVPPVPEAGPLPIELTIPPSASVARGTVTVTASADLVPLRFVALPRPSGSDAAIVGTELGPCFLLATSGEVPAEKRALEAQRRLNEATEAMANAKELVLEVRGDAQLATINLPDRPEPLLEATEADAAAYGRAIDPPRLALWWTAILRDTARLMARGERPRFVSLFSADGDKLTQFYEHPPTTAATRKMARLGLARGWLVEASKAAREAFGLSSPDLLTGGAIGVRLDGPWSGFETEGQDKRDLTLTFKGKGGRIAYEGYGSLAVPLTRVEQPDRDTVRFSVGFRGRVRQYVGSWDGTKIRGKVSSDPTAKEATGEFTLDPI